MQYYDRTLKDIPRTLETRGTRRGLAPWIRKFHQECGTLTPVVEEALRNLEEIPCLFLMTAHQPNLFAYSGVFRKATLNKVLAEKLAEKLHVPAVCFFGIADQDFTDDRWVKSAVLPDVERRDGILELRVDLPEKLMLNKVGKPSRQVLAEWRKKIETWFNLKFDSVERFCRILKIPFNQGKTGLNENFEEFWEIVEKAYLRAENYADFNAFVMSHIVNDVWGYPTLFARFSECQRIFEREFRFLLSHFTEYSRAVREATSSEPSLGGGVYGNEFETLPFWYHCDCGSKARLTPELRDGSLVGLGECLSCREKQLIDFASRSEPEISGVLPRISARSISMPLVFFDGLGVCCYVGGVGGREYLRQAKYVAERLGRLFPPVVVWRPSDVYLGVAQLEALMTFRSLSGTFDFSQYQLVAAKLKEKIDGVEKDLDELALQKEELAKRAEVYKSEIVEKTKALSLRQNQIRMETNFAGLSRNFKLLGNVLAVMRLYPCIVDFAVNVGTPALSEQWVAFLEEDGSLSSNVSLKTEFGSLADWQQLGLGEELEA